jgi:hypothetical protein
MQSNSGGADRKQAVRVAVAYAGGTVVRRGVMFLLAHSLFLALAISLFAAD